MKAKQLFDIIQLNIQEKESINKIISVTLEYIEFINENRSKVTKARLLVPIEKLLLGLKLHHQQIYTEELENALTSSAEFIINSSQEEYYTGDYIHNISELEYLLFSIMNRINNSQDKSFNFGDLYIPKSANKPDAQKLIEEAINILRKGSPLTVEAKDKIISHLENAIAALNKGNTSNFFGKIKEATIILGALGSCVGQECEISEVHAKVTGASDIVEQTSVNQNYKNFGHAPSCFIDLNQLPSSEDFNNN